MCLFKSKISVSFFKVDLELFFTENQMSHRFIRFQIQESQTDQLQVQMETYFK